MLTIIVVFCFWTTSSHSFYDRPVAQYILKSKRNVW